MAGPTTFFISLLLLIVVAVVGGAAWYFGGGARGVDKWCDVCGLQPTSSIQAIVPQVQPEQCVVVCLVRGG